MVASIHVLRIVPETYISDEEEAIASDVQRVCTLRLRQGMTEEAEPVLIRWTERVTESEGTLFTFPE